MEEMWGGGGKYTGSIVVRIHQREKRVEWNKMGEWNDRGTNRCYRRTTTNHKHRVNVTHDRDFGKIKSLRDI